MSTGRERAHGGGQDRPRPLVTHSSRLRRTVPLRARARIRKTRPRHGSDHTVQAHRPKVTDPLVSGVGDSRLLDLDGAGIRSGKITELQARQSRVFEDRVPTTKIPALTNGQGCSGIFVSIAQRSTTESRPCQSRFSFRSTLDRHGTAHAGKREQYTSLTLSWSSV